MCAQICVGREDKNIIHILVYSGWIKHITNMLVYIRLSWVTTGGVSAVNAVGGLVSPSSTKQRFTERLYNATNSDQRC